MYTNTRALTKVGREGGGIGSPLDGTGYVST